MSAEDIEFTKPSKFHQKLDRLYSSLDVRDIRGATSSGLFKSIEKNYDSNSNEDIPGTLPVTSYKSNRKTFNLKTDDIKGAVPNDYKKYERRMTKSPLECYSVNPLG